MEPTDGVERLAQARSAVRVAAKNLEDALNQLPPDAVGRPIDVQLRLEAPEFLEVQALEDSHKRYLVSRGFGVRVTFYHTERVYP